MRRFEYYSFFGKHGDETDQMLDDLGEQGWEAFAIIPDGDCLAVYLRREKQ